MTTLYIDPTGSGKRDGSTPENAGTLTSLNAFIAKAGPGGQVLLRADKGTYKVTSPISITHGGTEAAPVTIRGVNLTSDNSVPAMIEGTRAPDWKPGLAQGSDLFRLLGGANNLSFERLSARNFGDGVFRVGADISGLTITNVDAANVHRFFQTYASGAAPSASAKGLIIRNVGVLGYDAGAINIGYDSSDIVLQHIVGDSQKQDGGLYIIGVHLDGTCHDVLIDRCTMANHFGHGTASQYWNGDGFCTENGVTRVRFVDTLSMGNTDGGYDLKSGDTTLERAYASNNKENFRFWGKSVTALNCKSVDPVKYGGTGGASHVWLAKDAVAAMDGFTWSDSGAPVMLFNLTQSGATLNLKNTQIPPQYASQVKLYGGSKVVMG